MTRQHTDIALELKQDTTVRRARMKKKISIVLDRNFVFSRFVLVAVSAGGKPVE